MQQIPQSEMMDQNQQIPISEPHQMQPQNQLFQGDSNLKTHEKISKCITGSNTIPLMVLVIIIFASLDLVLNIFFSFLPSLGKFLFVLGVWAPMAVKIEKNTSTVRYGCLFGINFLILSIGTLSFPLFPFRLWCFVLFETLLIALSNENKKMKFFFVRIGGKQVIFLSVLFNALLNWTQIYAVIITVVYTLVYRKYLINKFGISNEKVEKLENFWLINWIKNKVTTFVSLKDVLEKEQRDQPLVECNNVQNPNESSFIPSNMYPNYYSGVDPNMQQMQPIPQEEEMGNAETNLNQPSQ